MVFRRKLRDFTCCVSDKHVQLSGGKIRAPDVRRDVGWKGEKSENCSAAFSRRSCNAPVQRLFACSFQLFSYLSPLSAFNSLRLSFRTEFSSTYRHTSTLKSLWFCGLLVVLHSIICVHLRASIFHMFLQSLLMGAIAWFCLTRIPSLHTDCGSYYNGFFGFNLLGENWVLEKRLKSCFTTIKFLHSMSIVLWCLDWGFTREDVHIIALVFGAIYIRFFLKRVYLLLMVFVSD